MGNFPFVQLNFLVMCQLCFISSHCAVFVPEAIHDIACFIGIQAIPVAMIAINEGFDFKRSYFYTSWTVFVRLHIPTGTFVFACCRVHVYVTRASISHDGLPKKWNIFLVMEGWDRRGFIDYVGVEHNQRQGSFYNTIAAICQYISKLAVKSWMHFDFLDIWPDYLLWNTAQG